MKRRKTVVRINAAGDIHYKDTQVSCSIWDLIVVGGIVLIVLGFDVIPYFTFIENISALLR